MSNAENHIKARVDAFVNDLSDLIRQSALEAVGDALRKGGATAPAAPVLAASPMNAWASYRSPVNATKRLPGERVRVSVQTAS